MVDVVRMGATHMPTHTQTKMHPLGLSCKAPPRPELQNFDRATNRTPNQMVGVGEGNLCTRTFVGVYV